ncbi:hypothetical protein [Hymenobacter rubidus]|uniref:hypothetical protein n=1 Tax=Hymenobacter rubidus TaxID=1441626 RepID=UPI00191E42D8|nr:hypothetical protein [Hymenobacter rubidus]
MAQSIHQLQPEVAAKYRCRIVPCRVEIQRLGRTIDLRTLTVAEADELVKDPLFTYLVPKRKRPKSAN